MIELEGNEARILCRSCRDGKQADAVIFLKLFTNCLPVRRFPTMIGPGIDSVTGGRFRNGDEH